MLSQKQPGFSHVPPVAGSLREPLRSWSRGPSRGRYSRGSSGGPSRGPSLGPSRSPSTFSIVARDPTAREWGIGVQSKFLAVGAVVPWARAEVGAVATQAWANVGYGPRGLQMLERGMSAEEVVGALVAEDEGREHRQVGVVDREGRAAAYTGASCLEWAGHVVGEGFCCQGNILVGRETVGSMAEAFRRTGGDLASRLISALRAGQAAGGDRRGKQSASLLVVREGGGYGGYTDRYLDLRVDDHPDPIEELDRLLGLFRLYFTPADPAQVVPLRGDVLPEVQSHLLSLGYYSGEVTGRLDAPTRDALELFHATENFEERVAPEGHIDPGVLGFMRERAAARRPSP